jgi:hypothetical protein
MASKGELHNRRIEAQARIAEMTAARFIEAYMEGQK